MNMRLRLILSFVFVMVVSIASVVLIARRSTAREIQAFMYRGSVVEVDTLVETLQDYYRDHGSFQGVDSVLLPELVGASQRGQGWQSGGMMAGQVHGMMNQRLRLADALGNILLDTQGESTVQELTADELNSAKPLRSGGRLIGYLVIDNLMGLTGSDSSFLLGRLNRAALIAGLIAGGISLVLAILLSDRLIQPVRQLTGAARLMARGDLAQRVPTRGEDELAELGAAFNQMADALQQAAANRRAMTADIAHELRTPLAVQRAHLEALQDGIYPPTSENLAPVLEQNLLLTRLVDDLRTLALADAGQLKLECTPTDMVGLVERIIHRYSPQVVGQNIRFSLDIAEDLQAAPGLVDLDAMRIEQIIGNLFSNAMRYTPAGGQIWVKIDRKEKFIAVSVQNGGPGIPEAELEHIFERFYRADQGRSRAEGGSGLGLAIARQLAEMHGGSLVAANAPQGGAIFTLALPFVHANE